MTPRRAAWATASVRPTATRRSERSTRNNATSVLGSQTYRLNLPSIQAGMCVIPKGSGGKLAVCEDRTVVIAVCRADETPVTPGLQVVLAHEAADLLGVDDDAAMAQLVQAS